MNPFKPFCARVSDSSDIDRLVEGRCGSAARQPETSRSTVVDRRRLGNRAVMYARWALASLTYYPALMVAIIAALASLPGNSCDGIDAVITDVCSAWRSQ